MEPWQVTIAVAIIGGLAGLATSFLAKWLERRAKREEERAARALGLPATNTEARLLEIRQELIDSLEAQNARLEAEIADREADAQACRTRVAELQEKVDDLELSNTRLRLRLAAAVAPDALEDPAGGPA